MFQFPGFAPKLGLGDGIAPVGLPHSEIRASKGICPSTRLIAACHVLLRLREPRHPSCALLSFPFFFALQVLYDTFAVIADGSLVNLFGFEILACMSAVVSQPLWAVCSTAMLLVLLPICQCAPFFVCNAGCLVRRIPVLL